MKKELYEQVLQHVRDGNRTLAEYGERGDVPHHIWDTWKYLPDKCGEKLLMQSFLRKYNGDDFDTQLKAADIYCFYPFITEYDEKKSICLGREGFLRYSPREKCFTVSLYPDGYDEVTRNCMSWGKFLSDGMPWSEHAQRLCSLLIWYNYIEMCDKFSWAMDGITKYPKTTYEMLAEFMKMTLGIDMVSFHDMNQINFMTAERTGTREHIRVYGDRVYNITNTQGKPVVRFCYDKQLVEIEWKDGKTKLSSHAVLSICDVSSEAYTWLEFQCCGDTSTFIKNCIPGLLAKYRVRLNWHEALSWLYTSPLTWLNVRNVSVQSFADLV